MDASPHEGRALVSDWSQPPTPVPSPQQFPEALPPAIIRLPLPEPLTLIPPQASDHLADMSSPSSSPSSTASELSTDSSESASSLDSPIPEPIEPPALSFEIARSDAADGVQYAMETYPTETSYIAEQFKTNGVSVESGDRLALLEELPNFAVKVKVLKSGAVGLMPTWNMEDPFERLARLNMEFNEAATCPREQEAKNGIITSSQQKCLVHPHARCPPQNAQTRRQFVSSMRKLERESASSSGSDTDSAPSTPELVSRAQAFQPVSAARKSNAKSVNFKDQSRKIVFRYYLPPHLNKKDEKKRRRWDIDSNSDSPPAPSPQPPLEEEDSQWWWEPWMEDADADDEEIIPFEPVPRIVLTHAPKATLTSAPVVSTPNLATTLTLSSPSPNSKPSSRIPPLSKPRTPSPEKRDSETRRGTHHLIRGRIRHYALRVFQYEH